jgi:general nucleoside transport system permease protein
VTTTLTLEERPATEVPKPSRDVAFTVLLYIGSILVALVISAILVSLTGGSWSRVGSALLDGSLRARGRWGTTLATAAPLLFVATGTVISSRAGLVNIGQEGQALVGSALAAAVAIKLHGPGPLVLLLALGAGFMAGGLWAAVAAWLRYTRNVPEVITTLLLYFVALQATLYALNRTFLLLDRGPNRPNQNQTSAQVPAGRRLPFVEIFGNRFPLSVVVSVTLAIVVAFMLSRTVWGFKLRLLGANARAAQRVGVSAVLVGTLAMVCGGGLAGLAGGMMLTGGVGEYRLSPGFANNVGWDGLLVALLARGRPLLVIPMAFVFAMLRTGSGFLAATGVERKIVDVVQALLVLALLVPPAVLAIRERRRALAAMGART